MKCPYRVNEICSDEDYLITKTTRKILSGLHDDIIEMLMKCEDIGEAMVKLRHILLAINTLLVESKK